jgi:AraC-like DNA-binding protein
MSPRTLQRQLRAEGTSLNRELQEIRRTLSIAALKNPGVAIDDVAFLLGYSEPSAFYRSFKRWTGQTPQEFRRHAA